MISLRDLAAWRSIAAPWSTDSMVEQDFLICRIVEAIFQDEFLRSQVAMRGGTVLHKGHLAPASRYSEDIDLVLVGERPKSHIKAALTRVIRPLMGTPHESFFTNVNLAVRNVAFKSKILRSTYLYDPASADTALGRLKVETNVNEAKTFYPLTTVSMEVPDADRGSRTIAVQSYDVNEMLGTKLRALLQRDHGRDLYDMWWASERSKADPTIGVDPVRVGEAFRFYMAQEGSLFSASKLKTEIDRRLTSTKFLKDMDSYLPVGNAYSPHEAASEFYRVYLPCIDA